MDFEHKLFLKRSENELNLSIIIQRISEDSNVQNEVFKTKEDTYYSAVISHAYYSIFYAAKAYLISKGIKTKPPEEHKSTYKEFSKLVEQGIIDTELFLIYKNIITKADALLLIFEIEKNKRGKFTYRKINQANKGPAEESIRNAKRFFSSILMLCEKEYD